MRHEAKQRVESKRGKEGGREGGREIYYSPLLSGAAMDEDGSHVTLSRGGPLLDLGREGGREGGRVNT